MVTLQIDLHLSKVQKASLKTGLDLTPMSPLIQITRPSGKSWTWLPNKLICIIPTTLVVGLNVAY
jgi:hypothetical protein